MAKRPPLALLCLVFGLLGLLLGLGDFGRLARFPIERFAELQRFPPTPRSVFWMETLRAPGANAAEMERLFIGGSVVLLIGGFLLLGATLSPRFRLLKPASENPGSGLASHVELGQMARLALATAATLWLIGCLAPLGLLLSGGKPGPASALLGGLPSWVGGTGIGHLLLLALLFVPLVWWLWGPRGPLFKAEGVELRDVLLCGFFAAAACLPAFLILFSARGWVLPASFAFSLADRAGWTQLIALSLGLPIAACLYLALMARLYAPRPVRTADITLMALGALAGVALAAAGEAQGRQALQKLDVGYSSLAAKLQLQPSNLQRFALVITRRGRAIPAMTSDDVTSDGEDRINSHPPAKAAVRDFLARRKYRTVLTFPAFSYLDGCNAQDWDSTASLRLELEMLERAPSPLVAQLLLEKLGNCDTSPENRAVLDRIADPALFSWPEPEGSRRLGAAYLRFGDVERARSYLLRAGLDAEDQQQLLGGISPLADGVVQGKLSVMGRVSAGVRVGLVPVEAWRELIGIRRPHDWRLVLNATHTDASGRFKFRHVPQGRYVLIVTGGGIGTRPGVPSISNPPGVVDVNRFRPTQTLRPFDIRYIEPTGVPPGTDPNTTV